MTDPREVLSRPAPPPDLVLRYGDGPDHVIDVRLPDRQAGPLVIFVHGGFWRAAWDRTNAGSGPLSADLVARGFPVAAIEFRRVGQPGGGWPGTFDDVARAIRATPELLRAESPGLDVEAPIVAGHSAGGQLALWYAVEQPDAIGGVLALAPVADLASAYHRGTGDNAVAELLGGGPDEVADRYARADPMARARPDVPTELVHGTEDDRVPVDLSRGYATTKGVPLRELAGIDHFGVIDPESAAWPAVLAALDTLTGSVQRR
ncbi:MAG TPA: alpha/beta hydrolase [Micromonosporaceae bacterium]|nr:alpha/beta hydrolase [Micromonosporaceae bacterium]